MSYSTDLYRAASQCVKDLIFIAPDDPQDKPVVALMSENSIKLLDIPITPASTTVQADGSLKIGIGATATPEDFDEADWEAKYVLIKDGNGKALIKMACVAGSDPEVELCVVDDVFIETGKEVTIMDITLPVGETL